ncbi:uncharacterized protein N0V89_000743 [Didymosphaeria variabile]|uniref:Uncharacterized protein n=1 Tax=Didymosphaeria variabile TaxID=1932322 RepID=A0A9W9CF81_9PLEO|nr:uncharacterized protein N0V89_000743 [Didymosphaeria variabile]KAJ4360183.1 hypothetical protein N0V89_000743 [Didymosphaeria variabile]
MHLTMSALILAATAVTAHPGSHSSRRPPFQGDFTINQYQLYPENADFDFKTGKLYIGQLWNASLGIYDPYTQHHEVVDFPGISHNPLLNMGGVGVETRTGRVSIVANGPLEFPTNGANIAGDRWLISYDAKQKKEVYRVNLTATSQGKYGGFQDVDYDPAGNTFVVGSFPGTLTKVSKDGKRVTPWYLPATINSTNKGLTGIATVGWDLLAYGDESGELWKFDTRAEKGVPTVVPVSRNHTFAPSDAIYLPLKYGNKVLLVAHSAAGVSVFESKDGWKSAKYKGTVPLPQLDPGTVLVAPVQIGDGIYQIFAYFGDSGLGGQGTAGNRTQFPFHDISDQVDMLLGKCDKEHQRRSEDEEIPASHWYYKVHQRRSEETGAVNPASWYYKGQERRDEAVGEEIIETAGWYYKGHQRRSEQFEEAGLETAGWYYKSGGS